MHRWHLTDAFTLSTLASAGGTWTFGGGGGVGGATSAGACVCIRTITVNILLKLIITDFTKVP